MEVTPYVGVWIETVRTSLFRQKYVVTPYVGVWIETIHCNAAGSGTKSLLMWECGLKPLITRDPLIEYRHSLCGSVD